MDNITLPEALEIIKDLKNQNLTAHATQELQNRVDDAVELLERGEFINIYYNEHIETGLRFWSDLHILDDSHRKKAQRQGEKFRIKRRVNAEMYDVNLTIYELN